MSTPISYLYVSLLMYICIAQAEQIDQWVDQDVIFEQPRFVVVDDDASIGKGSTIGCGVHILSKSILGEQCSIGHFTIIKNCTIGNNVIIHSHCVLENVTIESGAEIGPFAHLSEGTCIQEKAVIGNFVEVKRSIVGPESKAKHLTYLGDATLGKKVNIGGGTITCNYNGVSKHKTILDDHAFIGSNNSLVAPLSIGKHSFTAAGSTITENVPDHALAIGRTAKQVNKPDYAPKLLNKYQQEQKKAK